MDNEVIRTEDIGKTFGQTRAVCGVSLHVGQGEIYGFVGLNGAGKTTTIRMLLGMIRPTSGVAFLFDRKIGSGIRIWHQVGYLVETPYAYPNLTVYENLDIFRRMRNLRGRECIDRIIGLLKLEKYRMVKSRHLSTGNRQRLGLARAIMHEPRVLLLDEPVNGLDPSGIVEIRELLKNLSKNGTTVFLSSHILPEIALLADKIGIIHEGKLIRELQKHELEDRLQKKLCIDTLDNSLAASVLKKSGYEVAMNEIGILETLNRPAVERPETISSLLVQHDLPPREIYLYEENLEEYFLKLIQKN